MQCPNLSALTAEKWATRRKTPLEMMAKKVKVAFPYLFRVLQF